MNSLISAPLPAPRRPLILPARSLARALANSLSCARGPDVERSSPMSSPGANPGPPSPPAPDSGAALAQAYARLRRLGNALLQNERGGPPFTPTDIVHEAMARLLAAQKKLDKGEPLNVDVFRRAARAMNHIL